MGIKRICVFCGSSPGAHKDYALCAEKLGRLLAENKIELVYGGGSVGLMGVIARAVIAHGGQVTGVIPEALARRGVGLQELKNLKIVRSMHERKAVMAELSDAFIALPGGIGTFEEFLEVLTWTQLKIHSKPCALLNIRNYYGGLMDFLSHAVKENFVEKEHRDMVIVEENPKKLLERIASFKPPTKDKVKWALKASKHLE